MDILLGFTLICFASVIAAQGFSFAMRENMRLDTNRMIVIMSAFACLWCAGYGWLGMSGGGTAGYIARGIGLVGIVGYTVAEGCFAGFASGLITAKNRLYYLVPDILLAVADLYFYSNPRMIVFTQTPYGTSFYSAPSIFRILHIFFVAANVIYCIVAALLWKRRVALKREKLVIFALLISGLAMVVGALFDTALPMFHIPSFPGSCFGAFIAFTVMCQCCKKFNVFSISAMNLTKYIYEHMNSPVLVFEQDGRLALINDFGRDFFKIGQDSPARFTITDLFELSREEGVSLIGHVVQSKSRQGHRLVSRNTQISCVATFTTIKDPFGAPLCTICFVYDFSRENKALEDLRRARDNLETELDEKRRQMEQVTLQAITTIANTIDAKDEYSKGHSVRVAEYSCAIARALGWPENKIRNLRYIALLHDIGKIGVPDSVLNKPGKLTQIESSLVQSHTLIGSEILKDIVMIEGASDGAEYHHERFDGTGYPLGLAGTQIPLVARIIGVADAYDAMATNRNYRKKLTADELVEELTRGSGTQFDPAVAEVAIRLVRDGTFTNAETGTQTDEFMDDSNRLLARIMKDWETVNRRSEERDYLTNLWNRQSGERKILDAIEQDCGYLAIVDLDNLKRINDIFGHISGDYVLKNIGALLLEFSGNTIAARMGGDEFLLFMKVRTQEEAQTLLERIERSLHDRKDKAHEEPLKAVTLSIGISFCEKGSDYSQDLSNADKALYYVKQNGKSGYYFYTDSVDGAACGRDVNLKKLIKVLAEQESPQGAMRVEYREFSRLFELVAGLVVRNRQPAQLLLISAGPAVQGEIEQAAQEELMYFMERAVRESLRKVDVCTRFSSTQFLIILVNAGPEHIEKISRRIFLRFYKLYGLKDIDIRYETAEMPPLLTDGAAPEPGDPAAI